jgi:hypothetical protein
MLGHCPQGHEIASITSLSVKTFVHLIEKNTSPIKFPPGGMFWLLFSSIIQMVHAC